MPHFSLQRQNGIAIIQFDNPHKQVMDSNSVEELRDLLPILEEDSVRAVVISGRSESYFIRHYCLTELLSHSLARASTWDALFQSTLDRLEALPKPVIAALNGTALGGGFELALAADYRVAKNGRSKFGLPEVSVNLVPGGCGVGRLADLVGVKRATMLTWRAKLLSAEEAYGLGIIDELLPEDAEQSVLARSIALACECSQRSELSIRYVKQMARSYKRGEIDNPLTAFKSVLASSECRFALEALIDSD